MHKDPLFDRRPIHLLLKLCSYFLVYTIFKVYIVAQTSGQYIKKLLRMDTNEQLTSEEAELVKALSLVPAVAELSGVSYRVAYNLIHGVGLSKPHPRAFAVVQIARQLVATTQALREKKIRRKRSSKRPKLYQVYDLIGLKRGPLERGRASCCADDRRL